jgi:hypothetical protein
MGILGSIFETFFFNPLSLTVSLRDLLMLCAICFVIKSCGRCRRRHRRAFDEDSI